MRRYPSFLSSVVLLGACGGGGGGDTTIDVTHDVCTPITVMTTVPTDVQVTGINDALAIWRAHGVHSIDRTEQAMIDIRFQRAAPAFFGVYDDEHSIVYINDAITDPHALSIVIAHELGHSFGLEHVTGRPSLMNPGNNSIGPTAEDDAALSALWGPCPTMP